MKYFFGILIFCLLPGGFLASQGFGKDRSEYYDYGRTVYAESHILPSDVADSVYVLTFFRVGYQVLTFEKAKEEAIESFVAYPQINLDYRDDSGIIRDRQHWTDTLYVDNYDVTKSKTDYIYGYKIKKLAMGAYQVTLELQNDYNSVMQRVRMDKMEEPGYSQKPYISQPIFVYKGKYRHDEENSDNEILVPYTLGGNIEFSSADARILLFVSYKKGYDSYNYAIKYTPEENIALTDRNLDYSGQAQVERNKSLSFTQFTNRSFAFGVDDGTGYPDYTNNGLTTGFVVIPLPSENLYPGSYEFTIVPLGSTDTSKASFRVEWTNMPLSLRNPEYAVEIMKYILTDKQYDEISDGSDPEIRKKIWEYWKKFDPTKYTPYNEAMAAYFKRADYAFFNFQTIQEKDGAISDRGKIYILKGRPSNVRRSLKDDKTIEVWTYNNLKEKFIFETDPEGKFKLTKIEKM